MNEPHQYSEQDVEDALMRNAYAEGRKDEREAWLPVLEALKAICDEQDARQGHASCETYDKARAAIQKAEGTT